MICCVESSKVYNTVYDLKQSLHQMPKILTLNTMSTRLYIYIAVLIAVDVSVCDVTRVRCEGALCEFGHFLEFYSIATINKVSVYKSPGTISVSEAKFQASIHFDDTIVLV